MTVPIAVSPGRQGFGPQLALSYDSGASNGPFGLGWNLTIPNISRKTDKGLPRYWDAAESDTFILTGAEDLVPVYRQDPDGSWIVGHPGYRRDPDEFWVRDQEGRLVVHEDERDGYLVRRYRPRTEGLFARIERWTNQTDPADTFWRSISKENITTWYGKSGESRIADPSDPSRIFSWLICESYDDKGNAIVYEYKAENSAGVDLMQTNERNRTRTANRYLKRIKYGNVTPRQPDEDLSLRTDWMFEVVFDYDEGHVGPGPGDDESLISVRNALGDVHSWPAARPDSFSTYRADFEVRTYRLCRRVLMFHHFDELGRPDYLVRSTEFTYDEGPILTYLRAVTHSGYRHQDDTPDQNIYRKKSLPPVEFEYSQVPLQDGLGREDLLPNDEHPAPLRVRDIDPASLENLPIGLDGGQYRFVDLDGEGLSGILTEQGRSWFYKPNLGQGRFGPMMAVARKPSLAALNNGQQQLLDLAGDGQLDLAMFDGPTPGFYERTTTEDWAPFRNFRVLPNLRWDDPNLRFVDLTGDGHADILITEEHIFCWYPSLAEAGFDEGEQVAQPWDEEQGPRLVFADSSQSIYLADLSGDGLIDLARIRNGEICYWPNLGYGRFGAKVTMDNAPWFDRPDHFDQRRIRLADVDGSGIADIIYLGHDGIDLYFNQAGNGWSHGARLSITPDYDNLASVQVTDLLGTGTACLVWSSPLPGNAERPLRYIDLMNGTKPHLLIRSWNNLGAETVVEYAPSTKFYLADKATGTPWITRLPFPVYVVEKQTVIDKWRNTRFSTNFSYHHGYFDGLEREFRGFGRVEQIDSESFGEFAAGNIDSPYIADDTLYQPPVKTVTWFHTGAFLDREHILSHYEAEYFPHWFERLIPEETNVLGSFRENALPEPDIEPRDLNADEWRQALRACKGMMLRQEIYELDVDALAEGEERPVKLFSTAYHNCHIRRLQPQAGNRHAVFLVTESEAITYHYELDLRPETLRPDPRIAHTLNLLVDDYGNVLQSVAVVYARVEAYEDDGDLEDADLSRIRSVQAEGHLAYTETRYTREFDPPLDLDNHRLPAPCEVLTYELTGSEFDRPEGSYFALEDLRGYQLSPVYQPVAGDLTPVRDLLYHQVAVSGTADKRLVEHVRLLFFDDDLERSLPLGTLNHLALPYETYKLALTTELLDAVFADVSGNKLDRTVFEGRTARQWFNEPPVSGYLSGTDLDDRFPDDDTGGQYWIRSGIAGFADDAADHFYLPEEYTDPFGETTTIEYDGNYDLFVQSSTDPVENVMTVTQFDYRVLAPREMRDINGNHSEVAFDILGLPTAMALKGKGTEADNLEDVPLDPGMNDLIRFFTGDFEEDRIREWLGNATACHIYYLGESRDELGRITYGNHPPLCLRHSARAARRSR